jgi:hypothetical protein
MSTSELSVGLERQTARRATTDPLQETREIRDRIIVKSVTGDPRDS